jgi:hypothetical protein
MLVNYMQKQNEIFELLRYFKALELFYNLKFFSQSPQRLLWQISGRQIKYLGIIGDWSFQPLISKQTSHSKKDTNFLIILHHSNFRN